MRKNLVVGILREIQSKTERRAPLTPGHVRWLVSKGIKVEVESSKQRIFKDEQYKQAGARVLSSFKQASLLVGIKSPNIGNIHRNKVYMVFSHTVKGQPLGMPLLQEFLKKRITLIDYEKITDLSGIRLVYFGRFAGICGLIDGLYYLGKRLEYKGIKNPFTTIKPAYKYGSLKQAFQDMARLGSRIRRQGLDARISPFIIGIIGHGHVSAGVQEILAPLGPVEIHPRDMLRFVRHQKYARNKIYKIVFLREEKLRAKNKSGFYFEEYLKHPQQFESNMDIYLPHLNMLMHTAYWDRRYPRLVTREMIDRLAPGKNFRLQFIADISCDINGSIGLTYKSTTEDNPVFTYDPVKKEFIDGYWDSGISVLAINNLPSELPRDSSLNFSQMIKDYVYQIAAHGVKDIANHTAIPREIREAVMVQDGRLTPKFSHLKQCLI